MAYGHYLEATYADGFVHAETGDDQSLYAEGRNVFHDILHRLPEAEHGGLVKLSLRGPDRRYDIDWTKLPSNARPVYFREMSHERNVATGETTVQALRHVFGYQYNDPDGTNRQNLKEITHG